MRPKANAAIENLMFATEYKGRDSQEKLQRHAAWECSHPYKGKKLVDADHNLASFELV
jgi:hypothetical protein